MKTNKKTGKHHEKETNSYNGVCQTVFLLFFMFQSYTTLQEKNNNNDKQTNIQSSVKRTKARVVI